MLKISLRRFNFQMNFDSSEECSLVSFLNDCLWFASLSLKVVLERPIYSMAGDIEGKTEAL